MNEYGTWDWLKIVLPLGQYTRIESHETAPGFPDVHYQIEPGVCGTLELKCAKDPNASIPFPKKAGRGGLRRSQKLWIKDNVGCGGTVWIVAEVTPYIYFIPGMRFADFNGSTVAQLRETASLILNRDNLKGAAVMLSHLLILGDL